ncbi:MAG: 2-oxoacid:acceptor oxidoreductase family protein [Armatimonadota bacterium]|nr:2-oxoacid:acceptor oxidoreductase family protein [Armatimonadota bacterium]
MGEVRNLLIVGVGGQGVVLASDIVAAVCLRHGYDVKKSEVHGMAQRGGVVYSHLRYGPKVHSPLIERGRADALLALEWSEALRWLPYLRPGGVLVVDMVRSIPPIALRDRMTWKSAYPPMDVDQVRALQVEVCACNAGQLAEELGNRKVANTILLGILSNLLEFSQEEWEEALSAVVPPHTVDINLQAFRLGRSVHAERFTAGGIPVDLPPTYGVPRRFRVEIVEAWCKGCGICVRLCPEECLRLDSRERAKVGDPGRCTGCQICQLLCPDFAIAVHEEQVEEASIRG